MPGYGVEPNVTISHIKMPKLQMSDLTEKMLSYKDSGAIHLENYVNYFSFFLLFNEMLLFPLLFYIHFWFSVLDVFVQCSKITVCRDKDRDKDKDRQRVCCAVREIFVLIYAENVRIEYYDAYNVGLWLMISIALFLLLHLLIRFVCNNIRVLLWRRLDCIPLTLSFSLTLYGIA